MTPTEKLVQTWRDRAQSMRDLLESHPGADAVSRLAFAIYSKAAKELESIINANKKKARNKKA